MTTAEDFDNRDEFSVAVFYSDNLHDYTRRFVSAEQAFKSFLSAIAAAKVGGGITRVIITDGGDATAAEWITGKGLTYPTQEQCEANKVWHEAIQWRTGR